MKEVIKRLKSYYLPRLFRIEKQIKDMATYLAKEVYNKNNVYRKIIFSNIISDEEIHYYYYESYFNTIIEEFSEKYGSI